MRKFKYIFFDAGELKRGKPDEDNYYYICTLDLRSDPDVEVVTFPLEGKNIIFHYLFIFFQKLSRCFPPLSFFNRLFYPFYIKKYNKNTQLCFVVYGYYITPDYLRYLKKKYPKSKMVMIHRDSYKIWRKKNPLFSDNDISELFDLQMTYDIGDSIKYNMIHFDEIESQIPISMSDNYPLRDVFFAGAAKDRLSLLIDIYDNLDSNGISCYFFITNVKPKDRIIRSGIVYSDKGMTYKEMLYQTINSRVILEVNQSCVDGYTSRFLEAVIYNKKLITNNTAIRNNRYYNEKYIQCFVKAEDIDIQFLKTNNYIDFGYKNEFSPTHLIELIDHSL